jgi:hypothetical protein
VWLVFHSSRWFLWFPRSSCSSVAVNNSNGRCVDQQCLSELTRNWKFWSIVVLFAEIPEFSSEFCAFSRGAIESKKYFQKITELSSENAFGFGRIWRKKVWPWQSDKVRRRKRVKQFEVTSWPFSKPPLPFHTHPHPTPLRTYLRVALLLFAKSYLFERSTFCSFTYFVCYNNLLSFSCVVVDTARRSAYSEEKM